MHRHIGTAALLGAAALSACSKEAPKSDSSAVAQTGATPAATMAASYDAAGRVATVIAKDFSFQAPDSIPAGWTTFRLINDGQALHHVAIARLDSGKTMADLQAALQNPNAPPPKWLVEVGGPNAPNPKAETNATLNLAAGNYVLLCFVDAPDHVPHVAKGMVRPLTVTASASQGVAPTADIVISLTDYAFTVKSGALTAGKHTIQVVNDGPQVHEIEILKLAPGKTVKDFGAWLVKAEGPPPASALGGVAPVAKGGSNYYTVDLTPGNYAALCFIPDAKDKKPHLEHGMIKEFTVQ